MRIEKAPNRASPGAAKGLPAVAPGSGQAQIRFATTPVDVWLTPAAGRADGP